MSRRRVVGWALAATVAVVVALLLAGSSRGLALLAYVLFLGALALLVLSRALRAALPAAPAFDRLHVRPARAQPGIAQLEGFARTLSAAGWSEADVHHRLRPPVREIVAARLSRRHGVDLYRDPERAHGLLGDGRAWELVRPDRERPAGGSWRGGGGWSPKELDELLDELEAI